MSWQKLCEIKKISGEVKGVKYSYYLNLTIYYEFNWDRENCYMNMKAVQGLMPFQSPSSPGSPQMEICPSKITYEITYQGNEIASGSFVYSREWKDVWDALGIFICKKNEYQYFTSPSLDVKITVYTGIGASAVCYGIANIPPPGEPMLQIVSGSKIVSSGDELIPIVKLVIQGYIPGATTCSLFYKVYSDYSNDLEHGFLFKDKTITSTFTFSVYKKLDPIPKKPGWYGLLVDFISDRFSKSVSFSLGEVSPPKKDIDKYILMGLVGAGALLFVFSSGRKK